MSHDLDNVPIQRHPWRLENEGDEHFETFQAFVAQPQRPRSLERLAEDRNEPVEMYQAWSRVFRWRQRALQIDLARTSTPPTGDPVSSRYGPLLDLAEAILEGELVKHLNALDRPDPMLAPRDIERWLTSLHKMRLLTAGRATEHHAHVHHRALVGEGADWSRLSDADLDTLDSLLAKLSRE